MKCQNGGCYSSWCETGWYSSPAAVDVNGDGINEVVASAYSLAALDGGAGALIWRAGGTNNRTWPGVVVANLEQDGQKEIVFAQGGGLVTSLPPGRRKARARYELIVNTANSGVAAYDLNGSANARFCGVPGAGT